MSRIMPAMSDGRITNYLSRCELNGIIQQQFQINSEAQYRAFLQQNPMAATEFLRTNFNDVLPYYNTTPCVTTLNWPGTRGGVDSRLIRQ